ncbi:3-isopropylmalate dehydratase large subunit [Streptomyces sp. NPDC001393]
MQTDGSATTPATLLDKIWATHEVREDLLYVDLHLLTELCTPQPFEALRVADRRVRRPDRTLATADHNVPTDGTPLERISDQLARAQIEALERNCRDFGIPVFSLGSEHQGIVHVIGPELGLSQPGMTIVCGDSHTATHGAFGALAFGVGQSEVEHVLATQCLMQSKPKTMRVRYEGSPGHGVTPKDVILATIGSLGVDAAIGHVVEYSGDFITRLPMEGRMTISNMTIEMGGRAGMMAVDDHTLEWFEGRSGAPSGARWDAAVERWQSCVSDPGATFDKDVALDVSQFSPQVTWGTNPEMVVGVADVVPEPASAAAERALEYMALRPGTPITDIKLDRVFIGSCTNGRIGDLRAAAEIVKGRKIASHVSAMVVPGSQQVKLQAEREGLDEIFRSAGFEWRSSGCSMCLGVNADILAPGERCAATSNRNFEGRQGRGGRTHLVSPQLAAAAAVAGHFVDIREWEH